MRALLVAIGIGALLAVGSPALAQQPAATPTPTPTAPESPEPAAPETIPAAQVATAAADLSATLRRVEARTEEDAAVVAVRERLEEIAKPRKEEAKAARERLKLEPTTAIVTDLGRIWTTHEAELNTASTTLRTRLEALGKDIADLEAMTTRWQATRDLARDERLPRATGQQISAALKGIASTQAAVVKRRNTVLTIQTALSKQASQIAEVLADVERAREALRLKLFTRDSAPLWSALADVEPSEAIGRVRASLESDWESVVSYMELRRDELVGFGSSFLLLWLGVLLLARRAADVAQEDEAFTPTARVLARSLSAAILVLLIGYPLFLPSAPRLFGWAFGLLVVVPALRLVAPVVGGDLKRAVWALSAWFVLDSFRVLLGPAPVLVRLLLLLEAGFGLALIGWLLRPARLVYVDSSSLWLRGVGYFARIAALLLAIAALGNLIGNASLSEVLVEGTLIGGYLSVLLYGSAAVLEGIWTVALHIKPLRLLRGVQRYEPLLRRRGASLIHVALLVLWTWVTLGNYRIREPAAAALFGTLAAEWPLGEVKISLGDLVAFGLTIWASIWLSRFVRFLLDEDVLPRSSLPRGVPYAVSSATHYVILLFGFMLAVAAAGFDLSRFALLVGALGVGIGIGLQDVVNNFVSGLILLFERPVQTGDTVQVGTLLGEVRRIGMRSSTVRTWSGAEVIVPNSHLVSDVVTNWTLSDRMRRIELRIGVAYGTDPERVIELLIEVARSHPSALSDPEPTALFLEHGESSLDFELRVWTSSLDWMQVKSELTTAVNRGLHEVGIEIPFPQRDLHIRSGLPG